MSLFKSLIKCGQCGYAFKKQVHRGKNNYLCNNYVKNSLKSGCTRNIIHESELEHLVKNQFAIYNIKYIPDNEYLKSIIDTITIDLDKIVISYFYHNGTTLSSSLLQYGIRGITKLLI